MGKLMPIRATYRSPSHLPIWTVIEKAGIWKRVGIQLKSFDYRAYPPEAEADLFKGKIDFISGDHLTPYGLVAQGKPIVSIASPINATTATLISRQPARSLQDLRGRRVADSPMEGRDGGFHHGRGNHMMYLIRSGISLGDVEWVESDDSSARLEALRTGRADAMFASGSREKYKEMGLHTLLLDPLPMINGPTITTSYTVLKKKKSLGERLVKALVLGIHFARTNRQKTEGILKDLSRREGHDYSYSRLAKMPIKPYPELQAVINAYELGCMKSPEAREVSPLALWDVHYLRELDHSGFIDKLYS